VLQIGSTKYDAKTVHVLPKLIDAIKSHNLSRASHALTLAPRDPPYTYVSPDLPKMDWFFERISSFLQPGDAVVVETGSSQAGILGTVFKKGVWHYTQAIYGSIGYAAGAAVGTSIAAQELAKHKRLVLITGEGSLQLTVQAFSILVRHGIRPLVYGSLLPVILMVYDVSADLKLLDSFVINNGGYTVERFFLGMHADYNDVPLWSYGTLYQGFAGPHHEVKTYEAKTGTALNKLLDDKDFNEATVPQVSMQSAIRR
jgi:pyruvate decarboxylase